MKEKLKYLPFNLITAIPLFACIFILTNEIMNLELLYSILLSFVAYIYDVTIHAKFNYLEDKVERLERHNPNQG